MKNTTEIVGDITKIRGPFLKIAVANMKSHDVHSYLKELQEKYSDQLKVVTSGNIWIDFIVPGYNKGTGLQRSSTLRREAGGMHGLRRPVQ